MADFLEDAVKAFNPKIALEEDRPQVNGWKRYRWELAPGRGAIAARPAYMPESRVYAAEQTTVDELGSPSEDEAVYLTASRYDRSLNFPVYTVRVDASELEKGVGKALYEVM